MARIRTHQIQRSMPTKKFAYDDYVLLPDDGQRYEIIDGDVSC